jgi:hypothetical protein
MMLGFNFSQTCQAESVATARRRLTWIKNSFGVILQTNKTLL